MKKTTCRGTLKGARNDLRVNYGTITILKAPKNKGGTNGPPLFYYRLNTLFPTATVSDSEVVMGSP
jgi:hypothetical protein